MNQLCVERIRIICNYQKSQAMRNTPIKGMCEIYYFYLGGFEKINTYTKLLLASWLVT